MTSPMAYEVQDTSVYHWRNIMQTGWGSLSPGSISWEGDSSLSVRLAPALLSSTSSKVITSFTCLWNQGSRLKCIYILHHMAPSDQPNLSPDLKGTKRNALVFSPNTLPVGFCLCIFVHFVPTHLPWLQSNMTSWPHLLPLGSIKECNWLEPLRWVS